MHLRVLEVYNTSGQIQCCYLCHEVGRIAKRTLTSPYRSTEARAFAEVECTPCRTIAKFAKPWPCLALDHLVHFPSIQPDCSCKARAYAASWAACSIPRCCRCTALFSQRDTLRVNEASLDATRSSGLDFERRAYRRRVFVGRCKAGNDVLCRYETVGKEIVVVGIGQRVHCANDVVL